MLEDALLRGAGIVLLASCLLGFTCVNQDFTAVRDFDIRGKAGDVFSDQVVIPYDARLTIDYVVRASSESPMNIQLIAAPLQPTSSADAGLSSDVPISTDAGAPDIGEGGMCAVDSQCGAGSICVDGACQPGCRVQAECAISEFCFESQCVRCQNFPRCTSVNLEAGGQRVGRFDEDILESGVGVEISAFCVTTPCLGNIEYTLLVGQHECRDSSECGDDEVCETSIGRCLAQVCTTDGDCPSGQVCSEDFGRCSSTGLGCDCSTTSPRSDAGPTALLLLLACIAFALRRPQGSRRQGSRRRGDRRSRMGTLLVALVVTAATIGALTLAHPSTAHAQGSRYDRATASVGFGSGVRSFTGDLGDRSGTGLSLDYIQALRYRWIGAYLGLSSAYFLTTQVAPPLARGTQIYSFRGGLEGIVPFRAFRFVASGEYERIGFVSNALVKETGPELNFNTVGVGAEARWLRAPWSLGLRLSYNQFFAFDGGLIGVTANFGIENPL